MRPGFFRLAFAIAFIVPAATAASAAQTRAEYEAQGYGVLWQGYAAVQKCVHNQDKYQLGPYVFVCDQFTYEYPYHYGDVAILSSGRRGRFMLCLGDDGSCMEGSVHRR